MDLNNEQKTMLKEAIYKVADAKSLFDTLNASMIKNKQWNGQSDIQAVCNNIDNLCKAEAGGIGDYLREY